MVSAGRLEEIETGSGFITTAVAGWPARRSTRTSWLGRPNSTDCTISGSTASAISWALRSRPGDDMGLGKSRQAVVASHLAAGEGKVLIVCPASLRINWEREILAVLAVLPGQLVALVDEATISKSMTSTAPATPSCSPSALIGRYPGPQPRGRDTYPPADLRPSGGSTPLARLHEPLHGLPGGP